MKLEHFAVSSHSERESDEFFIDLLGLTKSRKFTVAGDLIENFFGVKKEQLIIRYENEYLTVEVFIIEGKVYSQDTFTHVCILVEDRDALVNKAKKKGYKVIQVPRKDRDSYYLFLNDTFGNIYEVKNL